MITANTLAVTLPLNGQTTGALSALYPNYFVPAGFTFSIWGLIYLVLLGHLVFISWHSFRGQTTANADVGRLIARIRPLFLVSCALNVAWIFCWHYLQISLSVVVMVMLLACLVAIFIRISQSETTLSLNYIQHVTLETPFILYLAWICVATIANTTALLVSKGWQGGAISPQYWSAIMIMVATSLGAWFGVYWLRPAFTAVIAWAIWGIHEGQQFNSSVVVKATDVALGFCLVVAAIGFYKKRSLVLNNKQPARAKRGFLR